MRSYSVMVITKDSESFDPGSSPGRTFCPCRGGFPVFVATGPSNPVLVAQLDKASDYESEDWGFKSLQGYFFIFAAALARECNPRSLAPGLRRYSSVGRASD